MSEAKVLLRAYLLQLGEVPEPEVDAFFTKIYEATYRKGSFFTRVGEAHDRIGFVVRGLFRSYYTGADGTHHIRNFCPEGTPIGSYATVLHCTPAHVDIEALEESVVLQFSYRDFQQRMQAHPAWDRIARRVAELHYVSREKREFDLLTRDAEGRFDRFLEEFGHIEGRLTSTDIASFIRVRRETLSRLKRRRRPA
jgi:CRP-like cAMP-binding protein